MNDYFNNVCSTLSEDESGPRDRQAKDAKLTVKNKFTLVAQEKINNKVDKPSEVKELHSHEKIKRHTACN